MIESSQSHKDAVDPVRPTSTPSSPPSVSVAPSWFCLLHPLEDLTRVMLAPGVTEEEDVDPAGEAIVMVEEGETALCLTYNAVTVGKNRCH